MSSNDFDFTKAAQDFMSSMQIDTSAFDGALKNASDFNAKLTQIALDAATQNAELTSNWTQEAMKSSNSDPAAAATQQAQDMQNKFAAYAEVAKTAQEKTVELFAAASKEMQDAATKSGNK